MMKIMIHQGGLGRSRKRKNGGKCSQPHKKQAKINPSGIISGVNENEKTNASTSIASSDMIFTSIGTNEHTLGQLVDPAASSMPGPSGLEGAKNPGLKPATASEKKKKKNPNREGFSAKKKSPAKVPSWLAFAHIQTFTRLLLLLFLLSNLGTFSRKPGRGDYCKSFIHSFCAPSCRRRAQLLATTSPTKRRKVSPSSPGETQRHAQAPSDPAAPSLPSLPPRRVPSSRSATSSPEPQPPRYVPAHLQSHVPGTRSHNGARSPTPATATAGLTLTSERERESEPSDMPTGDTDTDARSPSPGVKRPASEVVDSDPDPDHEGGVSTMDTNGDGRPSIDEQIAQVQATMMSALKDRQKGYVVSMNWLKTILARSSSHAEQAGSESQDNELGPVDNSDLVLDVGPANEKFRDERSEPFTPLRPGLKQGEDFEVVPQEGWDKIKSWYGLADQSPVIIRYAHNVNQRHEDEKIEYELNPQIYTIYKLGASSNITTKILKEKNRKPVKVLAHATKNFQKWLKDAKKETGIDKSTKVRVWKIAGSIPSASASAVTTPAVSRTVSPAPPSGLLATSKHLNVDPNAFLSLAEGTERELLDEQIKDQTDNPKYNGTMNLRMAGLVGTDVIILEEQVGKNGKWASEVLEKKLKANGLSVEKPKKELSTLVAKTPLSSGRSTPAQETKPERGRPRGPPMGKTGLDNLGNTCYMNAATQCLRNVEELTYYFLSGKHKSELNFDNPLGFRGALASAYGALLGQIHRQPPPPFVDPRKFRNVIKRTHPFMDSYEQQDSQEYLMALMDGVAEDLNRIVKKPAVEKPDSTDEMVTNREALEKFAATSWELYKVRNDSVMTDLFAGMYKSTLHCPNCEKVSISFDPFINLTLPIPNRQIIFREVIVQKIGQTPVKVIVEVDASQSLLAFKKEVAKRAGISHNRLVGGEVYNGTFYQYLNEANRSFREVNLKAEDDVLFMEVEGAVQDRILIPVFNRYRSGTNHNSGKPSFKPFALPLMISLTQEETRDVEAIYNKVLKQVAALTTRDILNEKEPETDKADSNITSEDDDETASHPLAGKISQSLLRLFNMKILAGQAYGKTLPLGRNLDNSRDYSLLTSRIPTPALPKVSDNNSEGSTDGNSDASGEAEAPQSPASEIVDDWFLVEPSEALLLDWNDDAKDALFGGKDYDDEDLRGKATYLKPELLSDPEILKRKSEWDTRRTKGVSLDECLDEFGKEEILEEQESWFCPRCKTHTRAKKKFDLWSTPDVLVVHLKRFCIINRYRRMKLDTLVDFPLEELDLSKYITGPDDGKPMKYDLIGVDNHSGSMNGGHYTAYCKNFEDGRWYDFNDSSVYDIDNNKARVVSSRAYLLFYRRRSPEPLADGGQRLGSPVQDGISRDAHMSSSDESDNETSQMSLLNEGPSWSFGAMDVPTRRFDDEHNKKANDGDDDLFEDDDSNVAVGSSEAGDRMEDLRSGVTSDHDISFEDVPPLQDDGSEDELPVKELHVDEIDKMDI
ncbi:hypothetical protein N7481_003314 [Penicillium waksmanii]|uniref:uncharacterized protein n=1 Tax=Penicillium waksmanii TaxID=69791 RepID=UPI0025497DE0|nr:uncharacterized protein N7481_003314 [Penicillium waksmanii]KAJ5988104.1 hypothetical protein N7481_003314 [Penicillium waksmanii]